MAQGRRDLGFQTMYKVNCKHCNRYLFVAPKSMVAEGVICPNSKCKAKMNFKIILATDHNHDIIDHVFTEEERAPRIATTTEADL